ncbi:MAG: hypothetical protein M8353_08735 [ANME-2 cluster archaeon]|nr:hypothetical protein [ANME-2 cluster archaeon]
MCDQDDTDIDDIAFGFGFIETQVEGEDEADLGDPSVVDTPKIDWDYLED